ncbi:MAG: hypothetical protein V7L00_30985 [Nostoc sp.]|uniref:hypothetical protein n=1 Tax=Nostoc sp. TaxID=1180 RepID=UPI002FF6A574
MRLPTQLEKKRIQTPPLPSNHCGKSSSRNLAIAFPALRQDPFSTLGCANGKLSASQLPPRRHRALIIHLWIETQPLKQWDVAREYR